jgi:hypothetical protein
VRAIGMDELSRSDIEAACVEARATDRAARLIGDLIAATVSEERLQWAS